MNDKEFMEQKAEEMSVVELAEAMRIKLKQGSMKIQKPLTFAEEIYKYPKRFERLTGEGWKTVKNSDGVSSGKDAEVVNSSWNRADIDQKIFYVVFSTYYRELIRRKEK